MKTDPPDPRLEFNTPAEMLERATYLAFLGAGVAGLSLLIVSAVTRDPRYLASAVIALLISSLARDWLRRHQKLKPAAEALDAFATGERLVEGTEVNQLLSLLREWDALEQKRGSPDFDPWAVQALRNDIQRVVTKDPALNRLFHT